MHARRTNPLPLCVGLASVTLATGIASQATTEPAKRPFLRFVEEGHDGKLDVMLATYRRGEVKVTLHGSVHIADLTHYRELQRRFATFDALLYEMVGDPDVGFVPDEDEAEDEVEDDLLSLLMNRLGDGMGLADQLDGIDYDQANFVHADMTGEEFDAAMEAAGTSLLGELMAGGMPETDREAEAALRKIDMVAALRTGQGKHALRVLMARTLVEESAPRRKPTVIIEQRNERCLTVLQQQIAAGRRNLGVYYGTDHMAHLERRLIEDLGFHKVGETWITAWDCSAARDPIVERGLQRKRYRARQDLEQLCDAVRRWQMANDTRALPTWDALRATLPDRKLPGRADGVDPWGRAYVLREAKDDGAFEVRSRGSDGELGTEDDVSMTSPVGERK